MQQHKIERAKATGGKTEMETDYSRENCNIEKAVAEKAVVACQGVRGAYSQKACDELFTLPDIMYFENFESIFKAVDQGLCEYGVLPLENSTCGEVHEVSELLPHYDLRTVRSVRIDIRHDLMALEGATLQGIREVYSHEQALSQCGRYLSSLASRGVKVTTAPNTAAAARLVAESGRTDIAAVASEDCVELYGLRVLASDIQIKDDNQTRFICITK